jgi:hypothetical protein
MGAETVVRWPTCSGRKQHTEKDILAATTRFQRMMEKKCLNTRLRLGPCHPYSSMSRELISRWSTSRATDLERTGLRDDDPDSMNWWLALL